MFGLIDELRDGQLHLPARLRVQAKRGVIFFIQESVLPIGVGDQV